ncbi:MAG: RusA family crossover junction endodeoxyribonuclease [bacterium]|nr:RusA family crossover junction endodeoxyribonuclease [bacterium]
MRIEFTVPAVPVAQPAKDVRVVKAKSGKTFATAQTPTRHPVNAFKATAAMAARAAYQGPPLDGPLVASITFVFPRTGKPGWIKRATQPHWFAEWKAGRRVPYAVRKRCDRDNLLKSLQDALSGIVYVDDGLLYAGPVEKWVASADEQPHVEVVVTQ